MSWLWGSGYRGPMTVESICLAKSAMLIMSTRVVLWLGNGGGGGIKVVMIVEMVLVWDVDVMAIITWIVMM